MTYGRLVAVRLRRGSDVKQQIETFVKERDITAGAIVNAVGSLQQATVRMAGAADKRQGLRTYREPLEVVALTGAVGNKHVHLHIALANRDGQVIGGHLHYGCLVDTTVELVIAVDDELLFDEVLDRETGFKELSISRMSAEKEMSDANDGTD